MTGRNSGKDFSQGQWQLLSIARAVVAHPSLLLLDEITANLDAETEKMVLQQIWMRKQKKWYYRHFGVQQSIAP